MGYRWRLLIAAFIAIMGTPSLGLGETQRSVAILLKYIGEDEVSVVPIQSSNDPALMNGKGILLWSERGQEKWRQYPSPRSRPTRVITGLTEISRSTEGRPSVSTAAFTTQLDQLSGLALMRGKGFLTPSANGRNLSPKVTFRRLPLEGKSKYPASIYVIARNEGSEVVQFSLKNGQARLNWDEIEKLPKNLADGLLPGEYTLRQQQGNQSVAFSIESHDIRQWVMEWPNEMSKLIGDATSPLYVHMTVEHLLGQVDDNEKPLPYFADALDLIESIPLEKQTAAIRRMRDLILSRLAGEKPVTALSDPTGIDPVDRARQLISNGKWNDAIHLLDETEKGNSERAKGLAVLYRAVVLAESGMGQTQRVLALYTEAARLLKQSSTSDRFRLHNNRGGFYLNQARDRLYSHAFRVATGESNVLIKAALYWQAAHREYDAAMQLATQSETRQVPAVQVNQARMHAIMADLIHTLEQSDSNERLFKVGEDAAAAKAHSLAAAAIRNADADAITKASAIEVMAHLAFRLQDYYHSCLNAEQAEKYYLEAGSLAGVESIRRLTGLCYMRGAQPGNNLHDEALRELKISHEIAELLRNQMPTDRMGVSRAGFLARRSYVNELLIELLVEQGRDKDALEFAELSKARSLQDLLLSNSTDTSSHDTERRSLDEVLNEWSSETVALEYFLGSQKSWVFVVDISGRVTAHLLTDANGNAVSTRLLVAGIKQLQGSMGHQAPKMRQRLAAGQGFDNRWQNDLHTFYRILLPNGVLQAMREVENVLIIPHHVLHYFPFAALVTQQDQTSNARNVAKPRFLLDEKFDIAYAPSLLTWDRLKKNSRPISQVNAMGIASFTNAPELPGVKIDLDNLRTAFANHVTSVITNDETTEENALKILQQPGLLLFSTHGHNVADDPLSSFLLCTPSENEDGRLTAREIFETNVQADLVVMSACFSGLADRSPLASDDLFGLQRALLSSGSRSVLSGLWDVYDGTGPILMNGFFTRFAAGENASHALADSQRAMLKKLRDSKKVEPWLHPYFWAVYTLSGNNEIQFSTN